MAGGDNDREHLTLAPGVVYSYLAAAFSAGAGVSGFLLPQAQVEAVEACYDQSQIAIQVAAQHGEELADVRRTISDNRQLILDRTTNRWTAGDQFNFQNRLRAEAELQEKRLQALERSVDDLDDHRRSK